MHSEHLVEAAVGKNEYGFTGYYTTAYNVTGCIKPGSEGINHGELENLSFTRAIFVD